VSVNISVFAYYLDCKIGNIYSLSIHKQKKKSKQAYKCKIQDFNVWHPRYWPIISKTWHPIYWPF